MINVNELMLYSIIGSPIGIRRVKGLTVVSTEDAIIEVDNGTTHDAKLCSGIMLTAEWLERCGFVKKKDSEEGVDVSYGVLKLDVDVAFVGGDWYLRTENQDSYYDHNIGKPIKYLHQVQNLYFALTGEELNVRL